jgi:hypothetical protein
MTDPQAFRIPRKSELVRVSKEGQKIDIKPHIEAALNDDAVIEKIEGYQTNGGLAGDAQIDDVRAMDIIIAWDEEHGGAVRRAGLKEAEVLQQVNVVLRRRFVLDKKRKIVGLNEKHYKLLARS